MKPYTTIEVRSDGKCHLPIQLEGVEPGQLSNLLERRRLESCKIPRSQVSTSAWRVLLELEGGVHIELSSSSTLVKGWSEYGTVNIAVLQNGLGGSGCEWVELYDFSEFVIGAVDVVRWSGDGLTVDSGIRLQSLDGDVLTVVAVDIPGAMFITLPGQALPMEWQFPVNDYTFVPYAGSCPVN